MKQDLFPNDFLTITDGMLKLFPKRTLIVASFAIVTVTFGQSNDNLTDWPTFLLDSNFTEINSPKKIDKKILSKFPYWKKMSKLSGRFNASDFGGGPSRRLYFIAKANRHWIISYEHGGRGYHTHCFLITIDPKNNLDIQESWMKIESLDYLKAFAIADHSLFSQWRGDEY
ncbi:MAG: hypothetical protein ACHQ1D_06905 [Nitrososphaerales archaeon]